MVISERIEYVHKSIFHYVIVDKKKIFRTVPVYFSLIRICLNMPLNSAVT